MDLSEIKQRVFAINNTLMGAGMGLRGIIKFWRECQDEYVAHEILKLHRKGYNQRKIATALDVGIYKVGVVVTEYWNQQMKQKPK